jgi:hypothetical protein
MLKVTRLSEETFIDWTLSLMLGGRVGICALARADVRHASTAMAHDIRIFFTMAYLCECK